MKLIITTLFVVLLAAGCSQKADNRVELLEGRIASLEIESGELLKSARQDRTIITNLVDLVHEMNSQYSADLTAFRELVLENNDLTKNALKLLTNAFPVRNVAGIPPTKAPARLALSNGVPVAVYNQIFAAVQRDYPTDFFMQEILIKQQLESYKKLHP